MEVVQKMNALLSDLERIRKGGTEYESWVLDILGQLVQRLGVSSFGASLVPQMGASAGAWLTVSSTPVADVAHQADAAMEFSTVAGQELTSRLEEVDHQGRVRVSVPISAGFEHPIGSVWAITAPGTRSQVGECLEYAASLIAVAARAEKAQRAIDVMSEPVWKDVGSKTSAAQMAADRCLMALACRAVIVWLLEGQTLKKAVSAGFGEDEPVLVDLSLKDKARACECALDGKVVVAPDLFNDPLVFHKQFVRDKELRSALLVPLDAGGGEVLGVLAAYAARADAFSHLDERIAGSVAQLLVTRLVQQSRIDDIQRMKDKIDREMPVILAGVEAMARVHDARQNLSWANAQLSVVTSEYRHAKNSRVYKAAMQASTHIDETQDLLEDLVSRSKLSREHFRRNDMMEVLRDVHQYYKQELLHKNIRCFIEGPTSMEFVFDKTQINRVLDNLMTNAMYFVKDMRRPGEITIRAEISGDNAMISFRDNGVGIPDFQQDKVWDMFFTTKGGKGLGFGLSIVKRIVEEQHRGTIRVSSVPNYYTEFEIRLPTK